MKFALTIIVSILLSSCIFVEGQIIKEPQDIEVSKDLERFAYWERCATVDVTDKN
jgi:hypothetical protein